MNLKKLAVVLAASALALVASSVPAQAGPSGYTYDQFSMMFGRHAAQYDDVNGYASGQWAWYQHTPTMSTVQWGDPATWPPNTYEQFEQSADGKWVVMDGYGQNSPASFSPQVVSKELIGDVNCANEVNITPADGHELYSKWQVDNTAYCLEVWGQILTPGQTPVNFYHKQVWFQPSGPWCSNPYYANQICIKDYEVWKDDNPANGGTPGGPLVLVQQRDNIFAKGIGEAFTIHDYLHNGWEAYDRYYWTY
jgi:hypothetical protein